jgi:hypothetical protein
MAVGFARGASRYARRLIEGNDFSAGNHSARSVRDGSFNSASASARLCAPHVHANKKRYSKKKSPKNWPSMNARLALRLVQDWSVRQRTASRKCAVEIAEIRRILKLFSGAAGSRKALQMMVNVETERVQTESSIARIALWLITESLFSFGLQLV